MQDNYIKDYWDNQAKTHGVSHVASWGDNFMIDLEIETIGKYLSDNDEVLDIGCANGYSTLRQWESKKLKSIVGVDFSQNMVDEAMNLKRQMQIDNRVNFQLGDIRCLEFADNTFDVVYTTRVIINLPTWQQQIQAINECLRVTKPGGKVVFSEGFWEPLMLLNAFRALVKLPPLVEHDFNRYLKKQKLESYLTSLNLKYTAVDFSSIYYLGSRFLRELVTDASAYPGFSNPINEIFYKIEKEFSGGDCGIQQAYIVSKNT